MNVKILRCTYFSFPLLVYQPVLPHGLIKINMKIRLIANNYNYLSYTLIYLLNILTHGLKYLFIIIYAKDLTCGGLKEPPISNNKIHLGKMLWMKVALCIFAFSLTVCIAFCKKDWQASEQILGFLDHHDPICWSSLTIILYFAVLLYCIAMRHQYDWLT